MFHLESFPNYYVSNVAIVAPPDSFIICYMKNGKDVSSFVITMLSKRFHQIFSMRSLPAIIENVDTTPK